jgi:hypothetical protein
MNETTLRKQTEELIGSALDRTADRPELESLHSELLHTKQGLGEPMRVALVGIMKAGKSTLLNALLGEEMVATGETELTFNVNWLKYGDEPSLVVHFINDRSPELKTLDELESLTVRHDVRDAYRGNIKYIEVFYPDPILKTFQFIDTPGLASPHEIESQKTLAFLESGESAPDAILYLFESHGIAQYDYDILNKFQEQAIGNATPINAIGALTKVDYFFPEVDPLEAGIRIAKSCLEIEKVRSLFFNVYPVNGLLAFGAKTLTPEDFNYLIELARLPEEELDDLVQDYERLYDPGNTSVRVPADERTQLGNRLGLYGVWLACELIRQGSIEDVRDLQDKLLDRTGFRELYNVILSHFGNRAFLIKLQSKLQKVNAVCLSLMQRVRGEDKRIVLETAESFERYGDKQHDFAELKILRNYYQGRLRFSQHEGEELLRVTGEYGTSCFARLGREETDTIDEMLDEARKKQEYWQEKSNEPGIDGNTTEAARELVYSYQRITSSLKMARAYLYLET